MIVSPHQRFQGRSLPACLDSVAKGSFSQADAGFQPPVTRVVALGRQTFAALANPNYRRYFAGQATSLIGTWMQSVAQSWLVLQLTGSGPALGFVVGLQMLPVLVLGPYGGVVADRVDKRRLMVALQSRWGRACAASGLRGCR